MMPDCPCPSSLLPVIIVCSHLIVSAKSLAVVAMLAPVPSPAFDLGITPLSLGVVVLVWSSGRQHMQNEKSRNRNVYRAVKLLSANT
jgi:hypothetical protein